LRRKAGRLCDLPAWMASACTVAQATFTSDLDVLRAISWPSAPTRRSAGLAAAAAPWRRTRVTDFGPTGIPQASWWSGRSVGRRSSRSVVARCTFAPRFDLAGAPLRATGFADTVGRGFTGGVQPAARAVADMIMETPIVCAARFTCGPFHPSPQACQTTRGFIGGDRTCSSLAQPGKLPYGVCGAAYAVAVMACRWIPASERVTPSHE
jgi:hypothetical protein